jgi:FAD/FMN-containing dehydrogenase
MQQSFMDSIVQIAGEKRVSTQIIDLISASYDYSDLRKRPEAVVWPQTTDEVARIIFMANQASVWPRLRSCLWSMTREPWN